MSRRFSCGLAAALSMYAAAAQGSTVVYDNFDRVGSLNGSSPAITPGGSWMATPGFATDGIRLNAGGVFLQSAYLPMPVAITSGNVYTLSATMYRGVSGDDTAIMIFGFFDALPSWNGSFAVDEGHAIAIAPRNNRPAVQPMLNGFVSASDIPVADGTNGVTFGVRLYETAPDVWAAVAVELAPTNQVISFAPVPISLDNIVTIGMVSGSTFPPYIDNFTLEVTPVSPACACPGDMDDSGTLDGLDIQLLVDCLVDAGGGSPALCACADVDGQSGDEVDDVTAFVEAVLNDHGCEP